VKVFRAVVAIALAALGCWCLFWLPLFLALALFAESGEGWTSYLILAAFVVGRIVGEIRLDVFDGL